MKYHVNNLMEVWAFIFIIFYCFCFYNCSCSYPLSLPPPSPTVFLPKSIPILLCPWVMHKCSLVSLPCTPAAMQPKGSLQSLGHRHSCGALQRENSLITVNEQPLEMVHPGTLRYKLLEPVLLLWKERFAGMDTWVCVKGMGHEAIRQSISKALLTYHQKHVDGASKKMKDPLIHDDRTLLLADPCHGKSKKFGSPGSGADYQKSYR